MLCKPHKHQGVRHRVGLSQVEKAEMWYEICLALKRPHLHAVDRITSTTADHEGKERGNSKPYRVTGLDGEPLDL